MSRDFTMPEFLFLLQSMRWTVLLSLIAFVGGGIVGLIIALLRVAPFAPLRWFAVGYIQLFQGTPVLMQLFLAFYGLPVLLNIQVDPWSAVSLVFTLYSAAFLGEIWRGSIQAIPRPQWEAAACISLGFLSQLWYVILPQAMRISMTRAGQLMTNATFKPMIVYPVVAALYFILCWPLSSLSQVLERRIDASLGIKRHL
jgi:polar amino acid transport system permease protein